MFCYGLKKHIGAYIAVLGETETVSQKMNIKMTDENVGSGNANWDWSDGLQLPENTTMSIYGYAKLDVIYTDTDGGGKYFLVPKDIPLNPTFYRWFLPVCSGKSRSGFETKVLTDDGMTYVNTTINEKDEYIPDIVARVNLDPQYGHYSVAALARRYSYETDLYNDSTWWAAITANAVLPIFGKDNLRLALSYGTGLGRYMQANFYDAFINPVTHEIETSDQFGGFAAYQHFWLDNLRSTLSYSYAARDNRLELCHGNGKPQISVCTRQPTLEPDSQDRYGNGIHLGLSRGGRW